MEFGAQEVLGSGDSRTGVISSEGQFLVQYSFQQLLARAVLRLRSVWALVSFHQQPASFKRFWITWRCALSISPEPMG